MIQPNDNSDHSRSHSESDATKLLLAEIAAGIANRPLSKTRKKRHHDLRDFTPALVESQREITTLEDAGARAGTMVSPSAVIDAIPEPIVAASASGGPALAVFCCDEPDGAIATYLTNYSTVLATRGIAVHIFSRKPIHIDASEVHIYPVGPDTADDLIESAREFANRAAVAFNTVFPSGRTDLVLLGHEWTAVPALTKISARHRLPVILSLHSLESQRSDMRSDLSRAIQRIEADGLRAAHSTLVQDGTAGTHAKKLVPECSGKLVFGRAPFFFRPVVSDLDPGAVKARFKVGPIDPTILFIGDLDDIHGPDVLMKAVPAILKNHKQARFIFIGDGPLQWPLRVHARYLLLENAVRIAGHLSGDPLYDLIQSADIVAVPSRAKTEDWPVLAAWATNRPVVATHSTAGSLLQHEVNSVLCYPIENSFVWGVERLLFSEDLCKKVAGNGHRQLNDLQGWNNVATQIETMIKAFVK